jgi:hypothetical protein
MVYFSSTMTHADIIQIIRQVDIKSFCLWQGEKPNQLYGVIKDSAYEYFIVACSMQMIQHMQYLKPDEIETMMSRGEPEIICGNWHLMDK